jgi:hypothetical protein
VKKLAHQLATIAGRVSRAFSEWAPTRLPLICWELLPVASQKAVSRGSRGLRLAGRVHPNEGALAFRRRGHPMRAFSVFALILASLSLAAAQEQHYKKPRAKPYHSESKQKEGKGPVAEKKLTPHVSNSQELRHVEQQTSKSVSRKTTKHHATRVAKAEHEKHTVPIHVASAGGGHGATTNQGKNPYKGRVRQKGNKH